MWQIAEKTCNMIYLKMSLPLEEGGVGIDGISRSLATQTILYDKLFEEHSRNVG